MSAPVDVLAVMDAAVMPLRDAHEYERARELGEARAAVAELVEAARFVRDWCEDIYDYDSRVPCFPMERFRAALAKFSGVRNG